MEEQFSQPESSKPLFHRWSHLSLRCSWVTSSTKVLLLGANPATSGKQPAFWLREFRNTPDQPARWEVTWGTARKLCKMLKLTSSTEPIAPSSYSLWKPFTYPGERRPSTWRRSTGQASSLRVWFIIVPKNPLAWWSFFYLSFLFQLFST